MGVQDLKLPFIKKKDLDKKKEEIRQSIGTLCKNKKASQPKEAEKKQSDAKPPEPKALQVETKNGSEALTAPQKISSEKQEPVKRPLKKPAEKPLEKPAEKPAEKPVEKTENKDSFNELLPEMPKTKKVSETEKPAPIKAGPVEQQYAEPVQESPAVSAEKPPVKEDTEKQGVAEPVKKSPAKDFLKKQLPSFNFWYCDAKASSVKEFIEAVKKAPLHSLEHHSSNHDFSSWLKGNIPDSFVSDLIEAENKKGNELKTALISVFEESGEKEKHGFQVEGKGSDEKKSPEKQKKFSEPVLSNL